MVDKPQKPPENIERSQQIDLFQQFLGDSKELSNSIYIWEVIPKYCLTATLAEKLATPEGFEPVYKQNFIYNDKPMTMRLQPAYLEGEDGVNRPHFPSTTEMLVEEVLKKILTQQSMAVHDNSVPKTWVRFSLRMIHKELAEQGRGRTLEEIKRSIQIMSRCNITIEREGKECWSGSILQDLITINRKEFLELEDNDSHHTASLPLFITKAINALQYRQFNFRRLMACGDQLSMWLFNYMVNCFTQAGMDSPPFKVSYTKIEESGHLQYGRVRDNRKKVDKALELLCRNKTLFTWESENIIEGNRGKVIDVNYSLYPSPEFIKEQKAANARQKQNAPVHDIKSLIDEYFFPPD